MGVDPRVSILCRFGEHRRKPGVLKGHFFGLSFHRVLGGSGGGRKVGGQVMKLLGVGLRRGNVSGVTAFPIAFLYTYLYHDCYSFFCWYSRWDD